MALGMGVGRVQLQDWSALPLYLKPSHWEMLRSSSSPSALHKAQELLDWAIGMGLSHPSEFSLAVVARLLALPDPVTEENRGRLHTVLLTVKSICKTRLLRARMAGQGQPAQLQTLPTNTAHFPAALAATLFPQGFTQPSVPLADLLADARLVPLRITNRTLQSPAQAPAPLSWVATCPQQAMQQLLNVAVQACGGTGGTAEAGLTNFQLLGSQRQSSASVSRTASLQNLLQLENQVPERSAAASSLPALLDQAPLPEVAEGPAVSQGPRADQAAQPVTVQVETPAVESPAVPETTQAPAPAGSMASSVRALAAQHYDAELPPLPTGADGAKQEASSPTALPPSQGKGRGKGKNKGKGRGKGKNKGKGKGKVAKKRPAAAEPLKRPAAALTAKPESKTLTVAECLRLRPLGCSKCRQRPGCCPSCWRNRGKVVI